MFIYYLLIGLADVMFGTQFLLNGKYEEKNGSSMRSATLFTFGTSLAGSVILLAVNNFTLALTPFTVIMALVYATNCFITGFISTKTLGRANLSVFSVFCMSGGMLLPFFFGIIRYGEPLTFAKVLCTLIIIVAMLLTIEKGQGKNDWFFFIAIFIFNGLSGVIAMLFTNNQTFEKSGSGDFSFLKTAFCAVIALGMFFFFALKKESQTTDTPKTIPPVKSLFNTPAILYMTIFGIIANVGNYILVYALEKGIEGSVQYSLVTGGTMIVTTLLGFLTKKKPTKRNILSVAIAVVGILCLFLPF